MKKTKKGLKKMKKKILILSSLVSFSLIGAEIKNEEVKNPNKTKQETQDVNLNIDKEQGFQAIYDQDGKIVEKTQYSQGKKNGMSYLYDKNGIVSEIKFYYQGELLGNVEDEEIDTTKINGVFRGVNREEMGLFEMQVSKETFETPLVEGRAQGVGKSVVIDDLSAPNNKGERTLFYEDGRLKKRETNYQDVGKEIAEYSYTDDNFFVSKTYISNGVKTKTNMDMNGNGDFTKYYSNGNIRESYKKKDNKIEGETLAYHPNGNLWERGVAIDGKADGVWKRYNKNGDIESVVIYANGRFLGAPVLRGKVEDFINGGFVIKNSSASSSELRDEVSFSLKDGLVDGLVRVCNSSRANIEAHYKRQKIHGIANIYDDNGARMLLYNEGMYIGDLKEEKDFSHFSGEFKSDNFDGSHSVAIFDDGYVKELKIYDKDNNLVEIKRDKESYIETKIEKGKESVEKSKNNIVQKLENGKKVSEKYSFFPAGFINKRYKDGKLVKIEVNIMNAEFVIKQDLGDKEPNGILSAEAKEKKLEIAFKEGVPNGRLRVLDKDGKIENELELVNGVINGEYSLIDSKWGEKCKLLFKNNKAIGGGCGQEGKKSLVYFNDGEIFEMHKDGKLLGRYIGLDRWNASLDIKVDKNGKMSAEFSDQKISVKGSIFKGVADYNNFTGEVAYTMENMLYLLPVKKGVVEGKAQILFPFFGAKIGYQTYRNDLREGITELDYMNGKVDRIVYEKGLPISKKDYLNAELVKKTDFKKGVAWLYKDGEIVKKIEEPIKRQYFKDGFGDEGTIFEYNAKGELQSVEFKYNPFSGEETIKITDSELLKKGSVNGIYKYHNQLKELVEISYKDNLRDGVSKTYQEVNGISYLIKDIAYKKGRRWGESKLFLIKDNKRVIKRFWNDFLDGYTTIYNANGEIEKLKLYCLDDMIAEIDRDVIGKLATRKVRLYENGVLKIETQLRGGEIDGSIKYYDKEGKVSKEIDCSGGKCAISS